MAREHCPKHCVLYDRSCIECGECNRCDLNPDKICDNCMKCMNDGLDYRAIMIDRVQLTKRSNYNNDCSGEHNNRATPQ